ncbi:1-3-beta-glucanosyltransferase [Penicillium verhagenii]|nr:1-3-beta-glucanosyltransferase [Penicillium verhagenii]
MKAGLVSVAATLMMGVSPVWGTPSTSVQRDSITPITVKGNAFFQGNDRFYIRGVDYQPGGSSNLTDPIADPEVCKRDIQKFKDLGLNTVRVYSVDNSMDHDECMKALADAGIYLVLDVNTPKYAINRASPHKSYNDVYLQYIFATVEMFAKYDNTLAFFSGNEVINDTNTTALAAPYVKAVTRDIRAYLRARKLRQVPVGYSAADIAENRLELAEYMNCGPDDVRSDFFAFNDYSWCDPSSFVQSAWDQKVKNFTGYGIPLFLSEYGCKTNTRQWEEVTSLYSTDMTSVYSGGLVYEYSQEDNGYGLVEIGTSNVTELPDYTTLKDAFSKTKNPTGNGGYNSTGGGNPCPAKDVYWSVSTDDVLPAMPEPAKKYLTDGAGKGQGFSGKGSMDSGTESTATATPVSGTATGSTSSSTSSKGAAVGLQVPQLAMAPIAIGLATVLSTLFGASLVFL